MISTVVLFWTFATVVSVSVTWTSYLARLACEKTIRQAIDKGVVLDPATIDLLRRPAPFPWDRLLVVCGLLISFMGLGLAFFGGAEALEAKSFLHPLMGIGGGVAISGLGCLLGGHWLQRQRGA